MHFTSIDIDNFRPFFVKWCVCQCQKVRANEKIGEIQYTNKLSRNKETLNIIAPNNGYVVVLHGDTIINDIEYYNYSDTINVIPKADYISSQAWFVLLDNIEECYTHFPILNKTIVRYQINCGIGILENLKVSKDDIILRLHKCGKSKNICADMDGYVYYDNGNLPDLIDSEDEIISTIKIFPDLESLILEGLYNDYIKSIHQDRNIDFNKVFNSWIRSSCFRYAFEDSVFDDYSFYKLSDSNLFSKIEIHNDKLMFCIYNYRANLNIKENDNIELYFNNSKTVSFTVTNKPAIYNAYQDVLIFELFKEDIEILCDEEYLFTKVIIDKNKKEKFFYYNTRNPLVESLFKRLYAKISYVWYCNIGGVVNCIPTIEEKNEISEGECYVYLMLDTKNHYHKIGISNNPTYREKTLQGDKPSIIKLAAKKYPSRKIASAIESALHEAFSEKRVRGEWFNLNDEEVNLIMDTLV